MGAEDLLYIGMAQNSCILVEVQRSRVPNHVGGSSQAWQAGMVVDS